MTICPYGRDGALLWDDARPGEPLWQVQLVHDVAQPVTTDIASHFNDFLRGRLYDDDDDAPRDLRELELVSGIRLVVTRSAPATAFDELAADAVGYVWGRVAFYVSAEAERGAQDFVDLWDAFVGYRQCARPACAPLCVSNIHMSLHMGVAIKVDHLQHAAYVVARDMAPLHMPLGLCEAWPPSAPINVRMLVVTLWFDSPNAVTLVLRGGTAALRARLRAFGCFDWDPTDLAASDEGQNRRRSRPPPAAVKLEPGVTGGSSASVVCVWPRRRVDDADLLGHLSVVHFFANAPLYGAPVRVRLGDWVAEGTPAHELLHAIESLPSVTDFSMVA